MSHIKYPQPTSEELEADPVHWVGFNPFWWSLAQGQIADLAVPGLWENYTEEIDQGILNLMRPQELVMPVEAYCKVWHSADQTISTSAGFAATTKLNFNSEAFDVGGLHDGTNPSRITIPTGFAGKYVIAANVRWSANASGDRGIFLIKNNTTFLESFILPPAKTIATDMGLHAFLHLSDGDYVEIAVSQDSGGNLSIVSAAGRFPFFSCVRVGD